MPTSEPSTKRYIPDSVPLANQIKVYYAADVEAAGGVDSFLKSIGSDKAKTLPEIDISEEEWKQMLEADL